MGLLNEKRYGKIRIFEVTFRSFHVGFERGRPVQLDIK